MESGCLFSHGVCCEDGSWHGFSGVRCDGSCKCWRWHLFSSYACMLAMLALLLIRYNPSCAPGVWTMFFLSLFLLFSPIDFLVGLSFHTLDFLPWIWTLRWKRTTQKTNPTGYAFSLDFLDLLLSWLYRGIPWTTSGL